MTKRTRYAPSRRKRTTPRDRDALPLPFAKVSPDTPGELSQRERGNTQAPIAGELVDEPKRPDLAEQTERFTIELPGFEVECVRHLDRPATWIVGVWPAERNDNSSIRGACTVVAGVPRAWRGDLDRENQAVVARAVCIAIDEREKGGST